MHPKPKLIRYKNIGSERRLYVLLLRFVHRKLHIPKHTDVFLTPLQTRYVLIPDLLPERCVLESLCERPVTGRPSMLESDNVKLKKSDLSDAKEREEDDSSQASMSGGERSSSHPLAGRMRSRQEFTMCTMRSGD